MFGKPDKIDSMVSFTKTKQKIESRRDLGKRRVSSIGGLGIKEGDGLLGLLMCI